MPGTILGLEIQQQTNHAKIPAVLELLFYRGDTKQQTREISKLYNVRKITLVSVLKDGKYYTTEKEEECQRWSTYKVIVLNWFVRVGFIDKTTSKQRLEESDGFIYAEIREVRFQVKEMGLACSRDSKEANMADG